MRYSEGTGDQIASSCWLSRRPSIAVNHAVLSAKVNRKKDSKQKRVPLEYKTSFAVFAMFMLRYVGAIADIRVGGCRCNDTMYTCASALSFSAILT